MVAMLERRPLATVAPPVIEVTEDHIAAGEVRCVWRCPLALALADAWEDHVLVAVDQRKIHVFPASGGHWWAPTPPRVREFIDRFDGFLAVEPFKFEPAWQWSAEREGEI